MCSPRQGSTKEGKSPRKVYCREGFWYSEGKPTPTDLFNFWLSKLCLHYLNKWNSKLPSHLYCLSRRIISWFTHTHAASHPLLGEHFDLLNKASSQKIKTNYWVVMLMLMILCFLNVWNRKLLSNSTLKN